MNDDMQASAGTSCSTTPAQPISIVDVDESADIKPLRDAPRVDLDADTVGKGLAQLVLTVVRLLHELLERQAIRRIDAGSLSEEDIEALGDTLRRQAEEIKAMAERFGLREEDLNLDLGPLGSVL